MKILMLIDSLDIGGAETHLEVLSRELNSTKHKIIIVSAGGVIQEKLKRDGIKCISFPDITNKNSHYCACKSVGDEQIYRRAPLICRILAARCIILRILRREMPDLVHAHTRRTAFLVSKICQRYKIPLVVTAHAKFSMAFPKRLFSKWGDRTIAVSEDIWEHLVKQGVARDRIEIILNGVIAPRDNAVRSPECGGEGTNEKNCFCQPS